LAAVGAALAGGSYSGYRNATRNSMVDYAGKVGRSMRGIDALLKATRDARRVAKSKKSLKKDVKMIASSGTQTYKVKRRYVTRGYRAGRIKRTRRFKHDWYAKAGSVIKVETGGVVADANCVYVGFGTNPINITHKAVTRCITKELFSQAGFSIGRFDDKLETIGYTYELRFRYLVDPSDDVMNNTVVVLASNPTFETVAGNIATEMDNLYAVNPHMFIEEIALLQVQSTGGNVFARVIGEICCGNFGIYINSRGSISVQNRTLSSDGQAFSTDITNNPVHGKVYSGVGNNFKVRNFIDQTLNTPFFVPGLTPAFAVSSAENQSAVSRKPFSPQDLVGVRHSSSVSINPGGIRTGYLSYSKKMNLKNFYRDYHECLVDPTKESHKLGKIYMIGLEKMVNDRISEPNISVGYEVNLTLKVAGIYRRKIESVSIIQEI